MVKDVLPVSIPRWQWRTFGTDLSWLVRRLSVSPEPGRRSEEIHLVCLHSSHHAFVQADTLELRWRKETSPEGFEIWDTILRTTLPFQTADIARLRTAWGLARGGSSHDYPTVEAFIEREIEATRDVIAVPVVRHQSDASFNGFPCSIERVDTGSAGRIESFSIEHEDPSLMAQVLEELGLDARENINFLQGLRNALEMPAVDARNSKWPRKLSASIS